MKTLLYTILFLSTSYLTAQPTIGSDAIIRLGEAEPTTFLPLNMQNWDEGSQGPNQVWDYTTLSVGEECENVALDPVTSLYFDSFPNSDMYFSCTFTDSQGFTSEQHTFYQVEGEALQLLGNVNISLTNPSYDSIFIVYTDPLDWGTFPYSFEDQTEDSFAARVTSYTGTQTLVSIQNGTSTHEVDSYGTLTTPSGTFENTLRVKRIELAVNSIPGIPFTSPQESYRYTWYAENEKGVILNLDSIVIKDTNGNVFNTELTGSYRSMEPTSIFTPSSTANNITIYPNPTIEEINVNHPNISDYKLYIYSVDGVEVPYSILESTNSFYKIKLPELENRKGIYFLSLLDNENQTITSKAIHVNK